MSLSQHYTILTVYKLFFKRRGLKIKCWLSVFLAALVQPRPPCVVMSPVDGLDNPYLFCSLQSRVSSLDKCHWAGWKPCGMG